MIESLKNRITPLIALLVVGACFFAAGTLSEKQGWFSEITQGLSVSMWSAAILLLTVDSYNTARQEEERERLRCACMKSLHIPLRGIGDVFFHMRKATSLIQYNNNSRMPLKQLLTDEGWELVSYLNFSSPAPVATRITWQHYITESLLMFKKEIERVASTYALHLDRQIITLIEDFCSHQLFKSLEQMKILRSVAGVDNKNYPVICQGLWQDISRRGDKSAPLHDFMNTVALLTGEVSKATSIEVTIQALWVGKIAPRVGEGLLPHAKDTIKK